MIVGECSCFRINRLSRRVTRLYDRALSEVGLTINQYAALVVLARNEPLSLKQLGAELDTDPTTLNRTLRPLQERGLITIDWSQKDRRARVIAVTDQGRALSARAFPSWRQAQDTTVEVLGDATVSSLHEAIDQALALVR